MAVIRLGGGILAISGSIGGQVFSHNRSGPYIRARTTPVNPQSPRQNLVRSIIQVLAPAWSNDLTQAQRDQWEIYANEIVRTNKLGAQIKLTGYNHFIRSNTPILQALDTRVDEGPTTLTLPPGDPQMIGTVDEAGQQISVAFDENLDWVNQDDGHMFVYMSHPKAAGRNFIGGPFRFAGAIDGDSTTAPTSPTVLAVPFPVAETQVVVVRARISEEDGRLSDLFRSQSAVAA